jgi:hypothetical protein
MVATACTAPVPTAGRARTRSHLNERPDAGTGVIRATGGWTHHPTELNLIELAREDSL